MLETAVFSGVARDSVGAEVAGSAQDVTEPDMTPGPSLQAPAMLLSAFGVPEKNIEFPEEPDDTLSVASVKICCPGAVLLITGNKVPRTAPSGSVTERES